MLKLLRKGFSKYLVNTEVFLNEDGLSFYLLGMYMTDGSLNDKKQHFSFSLHAKNEPYLLKIRDLFVPNKPLHGKTENKTLQISNIECMNWLISYGCTPRKSKTLRLEKDIPEQFCPDFVRGLIDGDGSICAVKYKVTKKKTGKEYWYIKKHVYICSASKEFLEDIKKLIPKDINCNIQNMGKRNSKIRGRDVIATCDNFRLTFNDSNAVKLLKWCYYNSENVSIKHDQSDHLINAKI